MKISEISEADHQDGHTAPVDTGNNSLDNLADIYGDDIYKVGAARMFGEGYSYDAVATSIIGDKRGKPNAPVKIYRAVPKVQNSEEMAWELESDLVAYRRRGNVPQKYGNVSDKNAWYDKISAEIERLRSLPPEPEVRHKIEPGDWVTLTKEYAADHGRSELGNKFRIVSKTVRAKDLFTDGNSIHEWGWAPQS